MDVLQMVRQGYDGILDGLTQEDRNFGHLRIKLEMLCRWEEDFIIPELVDIGAESGLEGVRDSRVEVAHLWLNPSQYWGAQKWHSVVRRHYDLVKSGYLERLRKRLTAEERENLGQVLLDDLECLGLAV